MLTIRAAEIADARDLAAMAEKTFRETFADANTPEDMARHCRESYGDAIQAREIADPARVTLLRLDGVLVMGFAQLRWQRSPA